jgi:hypothetical protein
MDHVSDPFDPRAPFNWAAGLRAGLTARQLRGAGFTRLLHDVYISSAVPVTLRLRTRVALDLCGPGGHASHHTAAELWQAWVPDDAEVHVSVRRRQDRRKRQGVRCHLAHPTAEVVIQRGLPVSSPVQTFLELAKVLGLVDLVILGDSLVHRGLVTPASLRVAAERWRGHRATEARRAAALVRDGVESPMETRLRLMMVLAGLPEPTVAHELLRPDGRRRIRLDLSYPGIRLACEFDGRHHATSSSQWAHDLGRREDLDILGWRLIVVTSQGIFADPAGTLARIVQAFHDVGAAHVRLKADDEWRRHFPGRPQALAA